MPIVPLRKGIRQIIQGNLSIVEKINIKYFGTLEHPLVKMIIENTKREPRL
jgi:hypothetical protein